MSEAAWLYDMDGVWVEMRREDSKRVEALFQSHVPGRCERLDMHFSSPMLNIAYEFDFRKMLQTNTATGRTRTIMRELFNHAQSSASPVVGGAAAGPPLAKAAGGAAAVSRKSKRIALLKAPPAAAHTPLQQSPTKSLKRATSSQKSLIPSSETIHYKHLDAASAASFESVTNFCIVASETLSSGDVCGICLDGFSNSNQAIRMDKCGNHFFHRQCLDHDKCFTQGHLKCPICKTSYGMQTGIQPNSSMTLLLIPEVHCDGFEHVGTWEITYYIPGGVQVRGMLNPGSPYGSTARKAYIPDTKQGLEVISLLRTAFKRGLVFAVGRSVTNGTDNVPVWNGIHHKTSLDGGAANYGYPDPTYFLRVKEELAHKGVA